MFIYKQIRESHAVQKLAEELHESRQRVSQLEAQIKANAVNSASLAQANQMKVSLLECIYCVCVCKLRELEAQIKANAVNSASLAQANQMKVCVCVCVCVCITSLKLHS